MTILKTLKELENVTIGSYIYLENDEIEKIEGTDPLLTVRQYKVEDVFGTIAWSNPGELTCETPKQKEKRLKKEEIAHKKAEIEQYEKIQKRGNAILEAYKGDKPSEYFKDVTDTKIIADTLNGIVNVNELKSMLGRIETFIKNN